MSKFQQYLKLINEELAFREPYEDHIIEVYKNPKTLKNLGNWVRGLVTAKGDLYVVDELDSDMKPVQNTTIIHDQIVQLLAEKGALPKGYIGYDYQNDNPLDDLDAFFLVQRDGNSNTFTQSESYYDLEEIGEYIEKYEKILASKGYGLMLEQ